MFRFKRRTGEVLRGVAAGFVAGMRVAFALYALLCVAGVFASLARGRSATAE